MKKRVIYNHGKDSIPWGEKPLALAEVAKRHGFEFVSPDYRPSNDPDGRIEQLLAEDWQGCDQLVLVGSSMGAYVATVAAEIIKPDGLFLIAPAFFRPGYQRQTFSPTCTRIDVFHGWQDDVIPPENSWRFCQDLKANLQMFDTDHRMLSVLPQLCERFDQLLSTLS